MKLIYLNAELDSNKEYELNAITPQGFKVEITYKETSWIGESLKADTNCLTQTFLNASEIHNRFQERHATGDEIAFESNIRSEGYVRKIKDIDKVVITLQD